VELFRWIFRGLNRFLMLPWFRVAGGPKPTRWGGSILVLHCRGRRTGLLRDIPLNYAPARNAPARSDALWILAGFGGRTGWLYNLRSDPEVEVSLGRRRVAGVAHEITDAGERLRAIRAVLCHAGVVGYVYGFSPFRVPDERLRRAVVGVVALRIDLLDQQAAPPVAA